MTKTKLTEPQENHINFLKLIWFLNAGLGRPPSLRELAREDGVSPSTVKHYVNLLRRFGCLREGSQILTGKGHRYILDALEDKDVAALPPVTLLAVVRNYLANPGSLNPVTISSLLVLIDRALASVADKEGKQDE